MKPLVSVIIPCYNASRWIKQTIASVQAQTYTNLEIIVVDDGSKDDSPEIIRTLANEDERIRIISQTNAGVFQARINGVKSASGEYIALLDADDLWMPQKIEKQVARITEAGDGYGMVYTSTQLIDEKGKITGHFDEYDEVEGEVFEKLLTLNFVGSGSNPLIRSSVFKNLPPSDDTIMGGCEDWYLYLTIAEKHKVARVPERLTYYRILPQSMSSDIFKMHRGYQNMIQPFKIKHPDVERRIFIMGEIHTLYWLLHKAPIGSKSFWVVLWKMFCAEPLFLFKNPTRRNLHAFTISRYRALLGKISSNKH